LPNRSLVEFLTDNYLGRQGSLDKGADQWNFMLLTSEETTRKELLGFRIQLLAVQLLEPFAVDTEARNREPMAVVAC
jgi:hypothetical protein